MTIAAAPIKPSTLPNGRAAAFLLPAKLRLSVTGVSALAHVAILVALGLHAQNVTVLAPLNIDLIPQGDYMVDTVAIEGAAAAEAVEQLQTHIQETQSNPDESPNAVAMVKQDLATAASAAQPAPLAAPDIKAQQAELSASEMPRDRPAPPKPHKVNIKADSLRDTDVQERQRKARREARRQLTEQRDAMNDARASRQGGSEGHRAGIANGQAMRAARANYGAIISAELNRHKFYPAGARARGEIGPVGVSFTVGGSGRIAGHSIYRSSGSSALDSAVHSMMASAHASPPPGGSFHGSIIINFNLSH